MHTLAPAPDNAGGHHRPQRSLRAVALFEAGKGVLALLAAGLIATLGVAQLQALVVRIASTFGASAHTGQPAWLAGAMDGHLLRLALAVLLIYAVIRFVEAWGLWRARGWASWLGCLGAAAYLPLELHGLWQHPGWPAVTVLAVNLLVVWVLGRDCLARWRARTGH